MSQLFAFLFLFLFPNLDAFFLQNEKFEDLKFIFTKGNSTNDFEYVEFSETRKLLNHSDFDRNRPTVVYGYGYTEKYTSLSTQTVVLSFIDRRDYNVLVVSWSNYSNGKYALEAIPNAQKVGQIVGKVLIAMREQGFNLENFHLVGHSLGAHLVGYIGRSVYKNSNERFKISRITALDPSGVLFFGLPAMLTEPLRKNDGIFVDAIHTDSTFFGTRSNVGHADFWPNEGKNQPECPLATLDINSEQNFCSHRRSWAYYSESVRSINQKTFESVSCMSWDDFTNNQCDDMEMNYMGFNADPSQEGNFYLQTNSKAPFNRGENGTTYRN